MENPYVVREKKGFYYILSEESYNYEISKEIQNSILVVINLFYLDTVDKYLKYLDNIPVQIQVYIVSPVEELLEQVKLYIKLKELNNVKLAKKENRGRDISAFLVSCKEEILNYKYFCFVHDKKANYEYLKKDTDLWIDNLWDNMLISTQYISNVIELFENNYEMGLLVPPEPVGEHMLYGIDNTWGKDYENTRILADRLNVKCCMSPEIPVITLGTVFWCRTDALWKLFQFKWKYEDFEDEPLPLDGTLSHAIERIFSFVAQDAGYYTGTIMCCSYAKRLITFLQGNMRKAINVLRYFTLDFNYNIYKMNETNLGIEKLKKFIIENDEVYLYGAGIIGKRCLNFLKMFGYEPKGFVVSKGEEGKGPNGLKVINLEQLNDTKKTGIIVTVGEQYHEIIINNLEKMGFSNYISYIRTIR